ncbi:MAG: HEAT repeat domain-containing protein [Chloroflexi bacterium]|nr:HEAT repeat domain-containing protein [Chloroflexota bacterium]
MNRLPVEDLNDPELPVRLQAVGAFAAAGTPVFDTLVAALHHAELEVRWRAVVALGWIGDARAVEPLARLLRSSPYEIRINVVWALGQIGDERAVNLLLDALHTDDAPDPDVAYNAALALLRLGAVDPLQHVLDSPQEYAFRAAHAALASRSYLETS